MLAESKITEARILSDVKKVISENLGIATDQIEANHHLENDLGCDSLDKVEITMAVEEHFDISVSDSQADATETVADIVAGVLKLLEGSVR